MKNKLNYESIKKYDYSKWADWEKSGKKLIKTEKITVGNLLYIVILYNQCSSKHRNGG